MAQPAGTATDDVLVAFVVDRATSGTSAAPTGQPALKRMVQMAT